MGIIYFVCASIIEKDGKFLLVRESHKLIAGTYNFPGGRIEVGEDIFLAATREVKEETGLDVKPEKILGLYQLPFFAGDNNVIALLFFSKIISGSLKTSEEHKIVKFFSYKEIKELDKKGLIGVDYVLPALNDYKKGKFVDLSFVKVIN
ncbi:MAG: NUDIX hydrolase [Nanoarchaeota archaeon]|nr:NUDIX hydrolase [Nanoarchaeota archaeon]